MGWRPREITAHGLRWPINFDIVKFRQWSSSCNMPTPIIDSQIFVKNDPHKPKCLWRRTKFWEASPTLGPTHRSLLAGGNPRPTRLWHGRIQARPNPPVQKSTPSHQRASGHPFRPAMGQRAHSGTHTGHLAEHPTVDGARHGPNGPWPREIPDQRGSGAGAAGRVKSPTNEAVARSGSTTAQSARAKVYAIAQKGFWAPL